MQHLGEPNFKMEKISQETPSKIMIDESKIKPWGKQQSAYTEFMFGG